MRNYGNPFSSSCTFKKHLCEIRVKKGTYRLDGLTCLQYGVVDPLFTCKMVDNTEFDVVYHFLDKNSVNSIKYQYQKDKIDSRVGTYRHLNSRFYENQNAHSEIILSHCVSQLLLCCYDWLHGNK